MNDNWMIVYKVDICTVHNFENRTLWENILKASYLEPLKKENLV